MAEHVCPWWIGYFLVSPVRRWLQNPEELIKPYITPGMIVLEPGPGMGFFTLPLARRVGSGRVVAVDIQPKMISALRRHAEKAGLLQRIDTRPDTTTANAGKFLASVKDQFSDFVQTQFGVVTVGEPETISQREQRAESAAPPAKH